MLDSFLSRYQNCAKLWPLIVLPLKKTIIIRARPVVQPLSFFAHLVAIASLGGLPMNQNLRPILWIATMAYFGYLWAGRGLPIMNSVTVLGTVIGILAGFLLATMFARRARRKRSQLPANRLAKTSFSGTRL
jgi:hypothetical protein